jgi:hypothetical protein
VAERVRSVLIDLGGVLQAGCWPGIAQAWAPRLGITTWQLLAAVFGGSVTVLTGRMSEDAGGSRSGTARASAGRR